MSVSSVSGHQAPPPSPHRHEENKEVHRAERVTKSENKPAEAPAKAPPTVNTSGQTVGKQVNTSA